MPDRPYTDDDLRAEAARQHATLTEDSDFMGVGEMMADATVASLAPQHAGQDIDGQPNDADGVTWEQLLPPEADGCEAYDLAQNQIHDLINGAADTSAWAVHLGVDGLEPDTEYAIDIDADGHRFARVLFAFEPGTEGGQRAALVYGITQAVDGSEYGTEDEEDNDSDTEVFDLISDIALKLRDATDSGEYHAVGLIYDLAMSRTTVAAARAELAGIEFGHV